MDMNLGDTVQHRAYPPSYPHSASPTPRPGQGHLPSYQFLLLGLWAPRGAASPALRAFLDLEFGKEHVLWVQP